MILKPAKYYKTKQGSMAFVAGVDDSLSSQHQAVGWVECDGRWKVSSWDILGRNSNDVNDSIVEEANAYQLVMWFAMDEDGNNLIGPYGQEPTEIPGARVWKEKMIIEVPQRVMKFCKTGKDQYEI